MVYYELLEPQKANNQFESPLKKKTSTICQKAHDKSFFNVTMPVARSIEEASIPM